MIEGWRWGRADVSSHLVQNFSFRQDRHFSLELELQTLWEKKVSLENLSFPLRIVSGPGHELSGIMICNINCNLKAFL